MKLLQETKIIQEVSVSGMYFAPLCGFHVKMELLWKFYKKNNRAVAFCFAWAESDPLELIYGSRTTTVVTNLHSEQGTSQFRRQPSLFAPGRDSCVHGPEKLIRKQKFRKTGNIKAGKQSPESSFRVAGPGIFDRPRWLFPDSLHANDGDCVLIRAPRKAIPELIYGSRTTTVVTNLHSEQGTSQFRRQPSLFAPGWDSCFHGPEKLIRKQKLRKTGNIKAGKQSPESSFRVAGPGTFDRPRWLCPDSLYANDRDCVFTRAPKQNNLRSSILFWVDILPQNDFHVKWKLDPFAWEGQPWLHIWLSSSESGLGKGLRGVRGMVK
ncbi:hypothetical protein CEXT_316361 [Caerostris extrusa]|uniref:Uncharacterized protein n=1 Tax=Caerostris extrusa TaxID=172846 RepID=A0AAV4VLI5_CAEEX|nr:hypothetical protein CEXT_316361 [Caerostris extrusa]